MRGGDTYYLNKPISMSEHSYLNLILPPYPWYQPIFYTLDSMVAALGPISTIIGIFTGIATLIGLNIWQRKKIRMFLKKCINITKERVNRGSNNKQQKSEDKESNKT